MNGLPSVSPENQLLQIKHYLEQDEVDYAAVGKITDVGLVNRLQGTIHHAKGRLFHSHESSMVRLIKFVSSEIAKTERTTDRGFEETAQETDQVASQIIETANLVEAEKAAYRQRFEIYFKVTEKLNDQINKLNISENPEVKSALKKLNLHKQALSYRLGKGVDPVYGEDAAVEPCQEVLEELKTKTIKWKKEEKGSTRDSLNPLEIKELETAAKYPEWVRLLNDHPEAFEAFMKWSIQDNNPAEVFIKYYKVAKTFRASLLSPSIGYARSGGFELLQIRDEKTDIKGVFKRTLALSYYNGNFDQMDLSKRKWVSVLDPSNKIHFEQGNYTVTIGEVLKMFPRKKYGEIPISVTPLGLVLFHPFYGVLNADKLPSSDSSSLQRIGQVFRKLFPQDPREIWERYGEWYDRSPMYGEEWTEENWIHKVPPMRFATDEEFKGKYGDQFKREMFHLVKATRTTEEDLIRGCHGYVQINVPIEVALQSDEKGGAPRNDLLGLRNVGMLAYRFAKTPWDKISMFADSFERAFSLADPNGAYTHRQRAGLVHFGIERTKKLLSKIFHELIRKPGPFQMPGKNCSYSIQEVLGDEIDYFRLHVTQCTANNKFLDSLLRRGKKMIKALEIFLGAWRSKYTIEENGKIEKDSASRTLRKNDYFVFSPGYFIKKILGKIGVFKNGEFYEASNSDERFPDPRHNIKGPAS